VTALAEENEFGEADYLNQVRGCEMDDLDASITNQKLPGNDIYDFHWIRNTDNQCWHFPRISIGFPTLLVLQS
jgi:hypothetical protein